MEFNPSPLRDTCRQLAEEIGADGVAELLESFLADTPLRLEEIGSLIQSGDQSNLRRAAHSLKGSSSIFGLGGVEELAHRLEHGREDGGIADQAEDLARLRAEFAAAWPHLTALARQMAEAG